MAAVPAQPGSFWEPLDRLRERSSYKWRCHPDAVLPAFVAEMDAPLARPVLTALREALERSDTGYATPHNAVGPAFADFAQRQYGLAVDPDGVHVVPDVMAGILETLRRITNPGDAVVVTPPVYAPFFVHIEEAGCRVAEAPLARDGDKYTLDHDGISDALRKGARVLLLCNPHNPTGRVFSRDELRRLLDIAAQHDAWILADEIHAPLVLRGHAHTPMLALNGAAERTFTFVSASKAWNIPGLKCAQLITASARTRAVVASFPEAVCFRTGHLGVIATVAAYREGTEWLRQLAAAVQRQHELFAALLAEHLPGVSLTRAEATYLAWMDCTRLDLGDDPAAAFLERGAVALDPGLKYGAGGAGHVRATIATGDAVLREVVARMARVVAASPSPVS